MKSVPDCLPCARKQVERILELVYGDSPREPEAQAVWARTLEEVDVYLATKPLHLCPAELSYDAMRIAIKHTGVEDPFLQLKRETNRTALEMLPLLQEKVQRSSDPLHAAAIIAVAGNIIDLGIRKSFDLQETLDRLRRQGFARSDFEQFRQELPGTASLLYIADNAGEIVFDRVFIEAIKQQQPQLEMTVAVNQLPILNDALREDAAEADLEAFAEVIDNGSGLVGTVLPRTGEEFQLAFSTADLILSKGQANFETLEGRPENLYFVLQAKCEAVAQTLGVEEFEAVFIHA